MRDFDVDVCLLPFLRLEALPFHVSNGVFVEAEPALEFVAFRHGCEVDMAVVKRNEMGSMRRRRRTDLQERNCLSEKWKGDLDEFSSYVYIRVVVRGSKVCIHTYLIVTSGLSMIISRR